MGMNKCDVCEEWYQGSGYVRIIGDDSICLKCEGKIEAVDEIRTLRARLAAMDEHLASLENIAANHSNFIDGIGDACTRWAKRARAILRGGE